MLVMIYDALPIIAIVFIAGVLALPFTGTRFQAGRDFGYSLYLVTVWFLYLGVCWARLGQTLGMRAWRVRISGPDGLRPDWKQSLIRFLAAAISLLPLGLGFWVSLFRGDRACWHDLMSHTRLEHVPVSKKDPASDGSPEHENDRARQDQ